MKKMILALCLFTASHAWAENEKAVNLTPLTQTKIADGRSIVSDSAGLSVYTFDVDKGTESKCYGSCAKAWPPVLVDAQTRVAPPVGVTTRKDGALQLTIDGHPVYYYIGDSAPGDINGEGLQGVWHLIEL